MTQRKIEVLAPAGSYEAFLAALAAGADAVYAGGQRFGARAFAENFTEEEMIRAIRRAHLFGRRFYLTVNTLLKDGEIEDLYEYLAPLYENGLDAVIVQDVGVFEYVKRHFPGMDIHASTQMTVTGALGSKFLESMGACRVVPARELSLEEIRRIREETSLEIECFVHGALCYCYSGQCLLSSLIGGRSGNRGQCAQPCRLLYEMNGEKKYFLSPKDICTLDLIPEMVEAGIDSFKIEGRMKKPEYVAGVTSMYRKYTDLYLKNGREGYCVDPADREMLMDLYNRGGSSDGDFKQHNGREMMSLSRPNHDGVPAVKVRAQKGREVFAEALTDLNPGDVIEVTGGKSNYTLGKPVAKGESLSFLVQKQVHLKKDTVLNRTRNESLIRTLHETYTEQHMQKAADGTLILYADGPGVLTVRCNGRGGQVKEFTAVTEQSVQRAQNRPLEKERIISQINRTGTSDFFFQSLEIQMEEDIFLPMQQLNSLRREAMEGLLMEVLSDYERKRPKETSGEEEKSKEENGKEERYKEKSCKEKRTEKEQEQPEFSVLVETEEQLEAVLTFIGEEHINVSRLYLERGIFSDGTADRMRERLLSAAEKGIELFAAMPRIFRENGKSSEAGRQEYMKHMNLAEDSFGQIPVSGVLLRNYEEFELAKESGFDKKIILDHNLYVFNQYGKEFWRKNGAYEFTAPSELNGRELEELGLSGAELIVYGHLPVMLSAQCVRKTSGKCTGKSGYELLTDRYGSQYPVQCDCVSCGNVIYSALPVCLAEETEAVKALAPRRMRIQFSIESGGRTREILWQVTGAFAQAYETDCEPSTPDHFPFPCTLGHFRRGIR